MMKRLINMCVSIWYRVNEEMETRKRAREEEETIKVAQDAQVLS